VKFGSAAFLQDELTRTQFGKRGLCGVAGGAMVAWLARCLVFALFSFCSLVLVSLIGKLV